MAAQQAMARVAANGAELEVYDRGSGEAIVLIQTALIADELVPLANEPAVRDHHRVILYHRRDYAASSPLVRPTSIARDAADCAALLTALGLEQAHVVGLSYSGCVALQLAVDQPSMVRSLTLLEPPHMTVTGAQQVLAAVAPVLATYQAGDSAHAVDAFMSLVGGSNWRAMVGRLPGAPQQMEKDAASFFESDWPAIRAWHFSAEEARKIKQPALFIGGSDSGPFFHQVRDLLRGWLPQTEVVTLAGANHTLAITHAADVATALRSFLQRQRQAVP